MKSFFVALSYLAVFIAGGVVGMIVTALSAAAANRDREDYLHRLEDLEAPATFDRDAESGKRIS